MLAFALIFGRRTEIYIACKSSDIITKVDRLLPELRDGVQLGHLPKYFKFIALLPPIVRRSTFWPELESHVQIETELLGAKVPIQGRPLSLFGILDETTITALAAGAGLGWIAVAIGDGHWALALFPLWTAIIATLSKLIVNFGHVFRKELHWTVSRD